MKRLMKVKIVKGIKIVASVTPGFLKTGMEKVAYWKNSLYSESFSYIFLCNLSITLIFEETLEALIL
jgi:hypothetical protein